MKSIYILLFALLFNACGSSSPFDTMDPEQLRVSLIKEAIEKSVLDVDKALSSFLSVAQGG